MCRLTAEPINPTSLGSAFPNDEGGTVVVVTKRVAATSRGKPLTGVEYEAYTPMAERLLLEISAEVRNRWDAEVVIEHRVGFVKPGEINVAICVRGGDSEIALDAARYCVDKLRCDVPIWKKEIHAGDAFWIEGEDSIKVEG